MNKKLHIRGFMILSLQIVPLQIFTPPSWITDHDSINSNRQMHRVPQGFKEKIKSNSPREQLRRGWYEPEIDQIDRTFYIAHVLRRPTNMTYIFYDLPIPRLQKIILMNMIEEN